MTRSQLIKIAKAGYTEEMQKRIELEYAEFYNRGMIYRLYKMSETQFSAGRMESLKQFSYRKINLYK